MSLLGTYLTTLIGRAVPAPAPPELLQAIQSVEVVHSDQQQSGFRMTFWMGRTGFQSLTDYALLKSSLLQPFNRVILVITLKGQPRVLFDGVITHQQFQPSNVPGESTLQVIGEDLGVLMDLRAKKVHRPALSDSSLSALILTDYAGYGVVPRVTSAPDANRPPLDQPPFQDTTDLRFLSRLASRYGFVTYIYPGQVPGVNYGYWGPRIRPGLPQPALSVNLGPNTTVEEIRFSYNALTPVKVTGAVQVAATGRQQEFSVSRSTTDTLSARSALQEQSRVREVQFGPTSGLTYEQAVSRAQGQVNASLNETIKADGELDTLRYGSLLEARRLVGVRGAGDRYDGNYYVQSVTHSLAVGSYKQSFVLLRQGTGAASSRVAP